MGTGIILAIPFLCVYTRKQPYELYKIRSYESTVEAFDKKHFEKLYRQEFKRCKKLKKNNEIYDFEIRKYW